MALSIQGNWTISVIEKQYGSLPSRFIITNATQGNGIYEIDGLPFPSVSVKGTSWQLTVQGNPSYNKDEQWIESRYRQSPATTTNNTITFDVSTEDLINDNTWNDLILRLSAPAPPVVVTPPVVTPPIIIPPVVVTPPVIITPPVVIPAVEVSLGKVYNKINIEDILPKQTLKTTYGIWLDSNLQQTGNLLTYHTCSNQTFTSSNKTIFQSKCDTCPATPMFDISYGHADGSGSRDLGGLDYFTLTKAVYGQYRNMCFGNVDKIKIGNKTVNHFYVINVKTDRMGDRLDEGLNELNLHHLSGSQFGIVNAHTGSNVKLGTPGNILRLIDDSRLNTNTVTDTHFYNSIDRKSYGGEYYYMVSGSLEQGIYNSTQPAVYGLSFPRLGVILLDADMLDISASFLTTTGSDVYGDNSMKLFTSLSGSALYTDLSGDYLGFKARKVKYEHVEKYFIRIKNQDFNFSNNPTWISGSDNIIIDGFNAGNPQTYISQIGMYNDNHELIAVGKINKPIKKSFTSEGLFSVTVKY